MTMNLEELVERACSQVLSEHDIQQLCQHAEGEGRSESVLLRLMRAGTAAARTNLIGARALTDGHRVQKRDVGAIARARTQGNVDRIHDAREAGMPFGVTGHAFERFAERYMPGDATAIDKLMEEAKASGPVRERTVMGDEQWVGPSGIFFVVHRDSNPPALVCVTVLPRMEDRLDKRPREGKPGRSG